ncbi:MAG TPA: sigma-70 family RNA polymerase sigma factor [Gemmatimonadaceae bacterium]|nr:sigma-70 family RNA polymerase sigma factor [Gemmatimonadaceae bacterium]
MSADASLRLVAASGGGDAAALRLTPVVARAVAGDAGAFAQLIEETRGLVCGIAVAITRDAAASEDVAQEVYLDAWRGLARLRNPASFLPWLRELTRNKARMAVRATVRRRARVTGGGDLPDDRVLAAVADPSPDALGQVVDAEAQALLAHALAAVPDASREVLVLYYREGRSTRQVAELLGTTEDAVRQRLARARGAVRAEYLARAGETLARSAPGAAFVATVTAALAATAAAPGVAAAATLAGTHAAAKTGVAAKLGVKLGLGTAVSAAAIGMAAGLAGGLLGVRAGIRRLSREALDEDERRAIRRYGWVQVATLVGFVGVMVFVPRPLPVTLAYATVLAVCWWQQRVLLPRRTSRRRAAAYASDPAGAAERARRDARAWWLGWTLGGVGGALPIAWLWWRHLAG